MTFAIFNLRLMAERLKQLRINNDLSKNEAADKVGVSRTTYSNWEAGEAEPSAIDMIQICEAFSVSSEYFCCLNEDDYTTVTIPREFNVNLNRYTPEGLRHIVEYCDFIATKEEYIKY